LKAATYGAIRLAVHQERLLIPASAEELIRELLMLQVEVTPAGLERIETGGRDFASALMLACGPYQRRGRWRSTLQDLCEQPLVAPPIPAEAQ
jgi:hypothetical protein